MGEAERVERLLSMLPSIESAPSNFRVMSSPSTSTVPAVVDRESSEMRQSEKRSAQDIDRHGYNKELAFSWAVV